MRAIVPAAVALLALPAAASAATLGLPVFSTAPGDVGVTAEFDGTAPSGLFTLSLGPGATIAAATGAPDLVGQAIEFSFTGFQNADGTFDDNTADVFPPPRFLIGGADLFFDGPVDDSELTVFLPFTEELDPETGFFTLTFDDPFKGFGGPFTGPDPFNEFVKNLVLTIDRPLPTFLFRSYCFVDDPTDCRSVERDGAEPLAEIDGRPVVVDRAEEYVDGPFAEPATLTFSTVGGPPVAPVPLPAGAWLLGAALAGLAGLRGAGRP